MEDLPITHVVVRFDDLADSDLALEVRLAISRWSNSNSRRKPCVFMETRDATRLFMHCFGLVAPIAHPMTGAFDFRFQAHDVHACPDIPGRGGIFLVGEHSEGPH